MAGRPRSDASVSNGRRSAVLGVVLALAVLAVILAFVILNAKQPGPQASPSASVSASASPSLNQELLGKRLTVLVIGTDSSHVRRSQGLNTINTDSMIVASISADQSKVALVSLPRDTVDIPLPDGTTWTSKVNGIEAAKGVDALVGAASELFGVPIDGYVQVDMDGLVALVDAVGGVKVNPAEPLTDPKVSLSIPAGEQLLDGATALKYVRTRVDTDYGRDARQQEVVLELVARLVSPQTDLDVRQLLHGLDSLETDLPLNDLPTLLEIARRAQSATVTRQVLKPPQFITFEGDRGDGRGYILEPDVETIRAYVKEQIGSS
jgi:polyisoprenyl-teichoic acid--peptidoglycan teichoic acid transferase